MYQLTSESALRSGPSSTLLIREERLTSLGSTTGDNCIVVGQPNLPPLCFYILE